ncbi:(2Fe-2S)-binding protein [Ramlibacter algicola]|uniref:(2Fe-2S)-binding protein n=1 Tax=Ramlibacter algicola TaxID=2795217 RepID=A0A934UQ14_9BURK|nr:(2Fe-2S)-binding protein [Ramlibacter algicola]MBK0392139.1 (2Fe-2S)-binding protein [Ramlibacter algicola]
MNDMVRIQLQVNGANVEGTVEPRLTLADFLREHLDLTGTHLGCEHGVCGACTVLLNGDSVRACLMFAVQVDGADVVTVEGLAPEGALTDLQANFRRHHALQCGFCTPGMLTTAHAFLRECPCPSREEVREAISGNLCRCTGYIPIVDAILATAEARNDGGAQGAGEPK